MKVPRKKSKKLQKVAKRLAAYSAAAAATVLTSSSANAQDVVHDITDLSGIGSAFDLAFNVITGATNTNTYGGNAYNRPSISAGGEGSMGLYGHLRIYMPIGDNAYTTSLKAGFVGTGGFGTYYEAYRYPALLPLTTNIGSSDSWAGNSYSSTLGNYGWMTYPWGHWDVGDRGILGLRFTIGGQVHYGWAQITIDDDAGGTLHGFGYNATPGAVATPVETREIVGDFDDNKILDAADWVVLRDNNQTDLGLDPEVAASLGDLDGNLTNDIYDFDLFRESYEAENGAGSFDAMVAASVPEPSSILLLAAGAAGMGMWRKKRAR